jgi:RNA polymerase sigma-70 factor (ECF subfamily)
MLAQSISLDEFNSMVVSYEQHVFRFHLVWFRNVRVARSLTKQTFSRARASRETFRSDWTPCIWLLRVAHNLAVSHARRGPNCLFRRLVNGQIISAHVPRLSESHAAYLVASSRVMNVWDSVAALSPGQRSVFILCFVEEFDLQEIASINDLPLSVVKSDLYSALATIRIYDSRE